MKKNLIYIFVILIIFVLNSCIFKAPPPKPILDYPKEDVLNNLPLSFDISWNLDSNNNFDNINFEVYYGKAKTLLNNKISTSKTFAKISNLEPDTTYYLKIRSIIGNSYADSKIYEIKTTDIPKIFFNINKTTINQNYINLSWSAEDRDGIKKYLLYMSDNPEFNPENKIFEGLNEGFRVDELNYGKTYYFKLIAYDTIGVSNKEVINIEVSDLAFYGFYPSDNSSSIPVNTIELKWNYSIDSKEFLLIFSPNNDLSDDGKYYVEKNITGNTFTLKNLPSGSTFYWKIKDVKNNFESPILKFTTSYKPEIEITYPKKTLETENYAVGVPENAKITWESTDIDNDQLTYHFLLKEIDENDEFIDFSNDLKYDKKIVDNYFNVNLEKGKYYALRVDADDGKGNYVKGKIVKFRTNLDPIKPYNLSPNNEINIPTNIATLTWESYDPDDGISYNIYFGENPTILEKLASTEKEEYTIHNLDYGKIYYWKVEAIDTNNATSISDIATFITNKKPIFNSSSPSLNAENISLKPTITWNFEDDNISYYEIYFSKYSENLTLLSTTLENSYTFSGLLFPETKYQYEIVAYDTENASSSSGIITFSTTNKPQVILKSPDGNNESLKPIFKWDGNDPDNDKLSYILNIKLSDDEVVSYTLNSTEFTYNKYLKPDTEYSWSVFVEDSNFATTISATQTFKTTNYPQITLISPVSQIDMNSTVILNWSATDPDNDDIEYTVYLNDEQVATTTNNSYELTDLLPKTEYFWKILAKDSNMATSVTSPATFITGDAPIVAPNITNIYDYYDPSKEYTFNEQKYPNKLKIKWKNSLDVSYYNIYKKSKNGEETIIATNVTNNIYVIEIPEGGKYNIYIKAFNDKGFYLKGQELLLNINQPPILQDYSPGDNAEGISLNPKIIWYADDPDSSTYSLYVYFGKNIDNLQSEYISNAQGTNEYNMNATLEPGTTYYWKIRLEDEMKGYTETKLRKFITTYQPKITHINISNNATNVQLNLNIEWDAEDKDVNDILNYTLKLFKENTIIKTVQTSNNNYNFTLDADSNYKIKIQVSDDKLSYSSTEIIFSTTKNPVIYNDSLRTDQQTYAKNGDKIYWNAYDPDGDELTYEVYIGESLNSMDLIETTTEKEYELSNLKNNTTYYWKIVAYDNKGGKAESEVKQFKSNAYPTFDNDKFYPSNNSMGVEKNVTLSWLASDKDNDTLKYDIYTGNSPENLNRIISDYTYNSYNIKGLENGKIYYWKVIAKDSYGGIAESNIMNFKVNTKPKKPNIEYTIYNGLEALINWNSVDPEGQNVTFDLLKSNDDSNYSTVVYNTTEKEYFSSRLIPDNTYYWKVRAIDEKEDYSESTITFRTSSIDTNIFTIEKGTNSTLDEIIDIKELGTGDFTFIQKEDNTYYLSKMDKDGTETTKDSSVTIDFTPYFIDTSSNITLLGINSGKIEFREYDNNLNLLNSTPTNVAGDIINDYIKLSDNSYIIVGSSSTGDFIAKIDPSNGSTLLNTLIYSKAKLNSVINIIDEDGKGKYILSGSKNGSGYLIKLDENFNVESEKLLSDIEAIYDINDSGNDIVLAGFITNDLVVKTYSYRLNEIFSPIYENDFINTFVKILKTEDGYLIVLNSNNGNIEILRTDFSLNVIEKHIYGKGNDIANGIIKTSDGGYIMFGQTKSFNDSEYGNSYIIKTDSNLLGWSTPE
ncbi:fibronectin type III domain-containing protein [Marinitoga sp. 1155]|uniref:fibronectin type III domain-containing protein n=1 Tax=Marinitoga sp. 1155 TaxID=1428448 RepID=UPI000640BAAA|nr:fibronectin type III domain-containing protein [Marinitoga sp. 1155]KLO22379.1 hypothetical protein X274_08665 [Marinitoga sp. 1155]